MIICGHYHLKEVRTIKRIILAVLLAGLTVFSCGCISEFEEIGVFLDNADETIAEGLGQDTMHDLDYDSEEAFLPEEDQDLNELFEHGEEIITGDIEAIGDKTETVDVPDESAVPSTEEFTLDIDGTYTTAEDVSLYIYLYDDLPDNFITKSEARELGWNGGGLEDYAPGMCIGGDYFGNREGLLPKAKGRTYTECDINTLGEDSRGAERLVFSNDGLIFYTDDHYESFTLLYDEDGKAA